MATAWISRCACGFVPTNRHSPPLATISRTAFLASSIANKVRDMSKMCLF